MKLTRLIGHFTIFWTKYLSLSKTKTDILIANNLNISPPVNYSYLSNNLSY